jgi:outer membrane beta-barrel protein
VPRTEPRNHAHPAAAIAPIGPTFADVSSSASASARGADPHGARAASRVGLRGVARAVALASVLGLAAAPGAARAEGEGNQDQESQQEGEASQDAAQEKRDRRNEELRDRVKSVQRKVFVKKDRFEIFPYFGLDLNDPFYQHFIVGGSVGYHLVDSLALEARGGAVIGTIKQNTLTIARQQAGAVIENPPEFKGHADLDLTWAPFYGKISVLGEAIVHFDTYLTAGPGIFVTDLGVAPAVNFGLGQRYFLTDWLVARFEVRNYVFAETRNDRSSVQNLMVVGFMLSGFLPTSFEYDFQ